MPEWHTSFCTTPAFFVFRDILFYDCRLSHTHVVMCTMSVRLPTDRLHICLVLNDRPDAAR